MQKYVWLFPIIFMFHEMEEIVGFDLWLTDNGEMLKAKFPKIAREYEPHSAAGLALGIFEEYTLCLVITAISVATDWYGLWLGGFVAYALHLVVHIGQSAVIKKYIPALLTSIITLPVSAVIIIKCVDALGYTPVQILFYSAIGLTVTGANLKLVHILMKKVALRLKERETEK